MSIFDLLTKEGRAKSSLAGAIKKANDKYAQHPDRMAALEKLRDTGGDEAIYGLLRRFGFIYDKTIEDETEKEWVCDILMGFGDRAFEATKKYILQGETIAYPLRVLGGIATPEKVLKAIDELAEREEPGYARHPQKKIQFLTWLGEWTAGKPSDVAKRIVPYLKDFDETVRFTAIEALAHQKDEATSRGPLLDAMLRKEEESRRIKVRAADLLAEAEWRVDDTPEHKAAVVEMLKEQLPEFSLSHEKLSRKGK